MSVASRYVAGRFQGEGLKCVCVCVCVFVCVCRCVRCRVWVAGVLDLPWPVETRHVRVKSTNDIGADTGEGLNRKVREREREKERDGSFDRMLRSIIYLISTRY